VDKIKSQKEIIEKAKELIEKGKVDIFDVDRLEDHMWAVADLWCLEKHLNIILNDIVKKLKQNPNDEKTKKLYELALNLLNETRKHRAKHLKKIEKLRAFGFWCVYKHYLGLMMQMGEVAAKYIYSALEENKLELLEHAKDCFETSAFAHDVIILLNKFADKLKGGKNASEKGRIRK